MSLSPFKSTAVSARGVMPVLLAELTAPKPPRQSPFGKDRLFVASFATPRSGLPSPLKSAIASAAGNDPDGTLTLPAVRKAPAPTLCSTESVLPVLLTVITSRLVSLFTSPTTAKRGDGLEL